MKVRIGASLLFKRVSPFPSLYSRCFGTQNSFTTPSTVEDPFLYSFEKPTTKKTEKRQNLWYHRRSHKRASTIMFELNTEASEEGQKAYLKRFKAAIPAFDPGDALEVKFKGSNAENSLENVIRGVVIGKRNAGFSSSFRIMGTVDGTTVEYIFPLYTPLITSIRLVKKAFIHGNRKKRVRRAKLYYLRNRPNSIYTVTGSDVSKSIEEEKKQQKTLKKVKKQQIKENTDNKKSKSLPEETDDANNQK